MNKQGLYYLGSLAFCTIIVRTIESIAVQKSPAQGVAGGEEAGPCVGVDHVEDALHISRVGLERFDLMAKDARDHELRVYSATTQAGVGKVQQSKVALIRSSLFLPIRLPFLAKAVK